MTKIADAAVTARATNQPHRNQLVRKKFAFLIKICAIIKMKASNGVFGSSTSSASAVSSAQKRSRLPKKSDRASPLKSAALHETNEVLFRIEQRSLARDLLHTLIDVAGPDSVTGGPKSLSGTPSGGDNCFDITLCRRRISPSPRSSCTCRRHCLGRGRGSQRSSGRAIGSPPPRARR